MNNKILKIELTDVSKILKYKNAAEKTGLPKSEIKKLRKEFVNINMNCVREENAAQNEFLQIDLKEECDIPDPDEVIKYAHISMEVKDEEIEADDIFEVEDEDETDPSWLPSERRRRPRDGKKMKCSCCDLMFASAYNLKMHSEIHKTDITLRKIYKCPTCLNAYTKRSHLKRHERTHDEGKVPKEKKIRVKSKCSQCDYATWKKSRLKMHENKHDPELAQGFGCTKCEYKTFARHYLLRHMLIHNETKKYKCAQCDFTTNRSGYMSQHKANHDGIYRFICADCGYKSNCKSNFNLHLTTHYTVKTLACKICNFATNRPQSLKLHELNHLEEKHLKCDKCDYATNGKLNLKQHMLKHDDNKRYQCSICQYRTHFKTNLRNHELTHSNLKELKCDKCNYATNTKINFRQHSLTHLTEKRFKCPQCDYATNFKNNLRNHERVHMTSKMQKCRQCPFESEDAQAFKRHSLDHPKKHFQCSFCEFNTNNQNSLSAHELIHLENIVDNSETKDSFVSTDANVSYMNTNGSGASVSHVNADSSGVAVKCVSDDVNTPYVSSNDRYLNKEVELLHPASQERNNSPMVYHHGEGSPMSPAFVQEGHSHPKDMSVGFHQRGGRPLYVERTHSPQVFPHEEKVNMTPPTFVHEGPTQNIHGGIIRPRSEGFPMVGTHFPDARHSPSSDEYYLRQSNTPLVHENKSHLPFALQGPTHIKDEFGTEFIPQPQKLLPMENIPSQCPSPSVEYLYTRPFNSSPRVFPQGVNLGLLPPSGFLPPVFAHQSAAFFKNAAEGIVPRRERLPVEEARSPEAPVTAYNYSMY